jgi:hypothetical protein
MRFREKCAAGVVVLAAAGLVGSASASAEIFDCTQPVTHSVTLTSDSSCAADGQVLVIGADHVRINLNGHFFSANHSNAIESTGYSYITIENGNVGTAGAAIVLSNARRATIRNVMAGGDNGGVVLEGGLENRVLDSSASTLGAAPIMLIGERGDVIRDDVSVDNTPVGGQLELDHSFGNRIVGNTIGELVLHRSSLNLIARNTVTRPLGSVPGGISGDGNFNVIVHNLVGSAGITLQGIGNVLLHNTIQP